MTKTLRSTFIILNLSSYQTPIENIIYVIKKTSEEATKNNPKNQKSVGNDDKLLIISLMKKHFHLLPTAMFH